MTEILRKKINDILKVNLPSSIQYLIGEEILRRLDLNLDLNSSDIAEATFTSKPSIVRFAQSLGFKGFKEFRKELLKQDALYYSSINVESYDYSFNLFDKQAINFIYRMSDKKEKIINVTDWIYQNKRVYIISAPENIPIGTEFADRLRFLGIQAINSSFDKQLYILNGLKQDDIVIFLISGYDIDTEINLYKSIYKTHKTVLVCTTTKIDYFPNPSYLIDFDPGPNPLRAILKPFGLRHILDQILMMLIYHDKVLMEKITYPDFKF